MRHNCKKHRLSRPQDQRKALLRALASQLLLHGEIKTTMSKAKALRPYVESIITFAKKGDLASRRQALKFIYDLNTGKYIDRETKEVVSEKSKEKKYTDETVLRKLFNEIGPKYTSRNGGYTRIFRLPPRRGDAAVMALIQLV